MIRIIKLIRRRIEMNQYIRNYINKYSAPEILDKKKIYARPVSATLGRLPAALLAAYVGTTAPFKKGPSASSKKTADILKDEAYKDMDDVAVSLGSGRPFTALKRTWTNKKTSPTTKLWGTAWWPIIQAQAALTRSDHYDPYANMVVNYHEDPAILRHEMGHAEDFNARKYPGLYSLGRLVPGVDLYQENKASKIALKRELDKAFKESPKKGEISSEQAKHIRSLNRKLAGALGTYVGRYMAPIGGSSLVPFLAQVVGRDGLPFTDPDEAAKIIEKIKAEKARLKKKKKEDKAKQNKEAADNNWKTEEDDTYYDKALEAFWERMRKNKKKKKKDK